MKQKYWVLISLILIMVGTSCNDFVIAHNEGKMPVKDFTRENKIITTALHQSLTGETHFPYLSDIFFGFSIGDIIRLLGIIPLYIGLRETSKIKGDKI